MQAHILATLGCWCQRALFGSSFDGLGDDSAGVFYAGVCVFLRLRQPT